MSEDEAINNEYEELVLKLLGRSQRDGMLLSKQLLDLINDLNDCMDMHAYDIALRGGQDLFDVLVSSEVEPCDEGYLHVLIGYSILHRDVPVEDHDVLTDWPKIAIQLLEERKREQWRLSGGPQVNHEIDMCIARLQLFGSMIGSTQTIMLSWPHLHDLFEINPTTPTCFTDKPARSDAPWGVSREILRGHVMTMAAYLS